MSDVITQILLGLVAVGFFSDVAKGLFQRKKVASSSNLDDANATKIYVDSASAMLTPLTNRLREAEDEATLLRRELQSVRTELQQATGALVDAREEIQKLTRDNVQLRAQLANGTIT